MGASASSDGGGGAQDNWWECCGARAGKSGRTAVHIEVSGNATKSVSAPFKSAFEGETPAPGTSTDNTVAKPRTALEAATSDPALEKITVDDAPKLEKKSRTTLRAAAPAPRLPVPEQEGSDVAEEKREAGVGVLFNRGPGDKGWVVKTTIKDSPAAKSGEIIEGDVLVSVDGQPVDQVATLGQLSKLLMGTEGAPLQLAFSRGGESKKVSLTRSNAFLGADGGKMAKAPTRKFGTWEATRTDFRPPSSEPQQDPASVDL